MTMICWAVLLLCSCQETLEERCAREAAEYTRKHCPVTVGKGVVLDSMTFDRHTRTIGYFNTVSGAVDDSAVINSGQPRNLLLQQVRNATQLKLYKEAGYSFRYVYYSTKNNGTQLFEATFRKSDYE